MKKFLLLLFCIFLSFAMIACNPSKNVLSEIDAASETNDSEQKTIPEIKEKKPEPLGRLCEKMNVCLYNDGNISVYVTSFFKEDNGNMVLKCDICNNSNENVFIALKYPKINGICSPVQMWADAKKGMLTNSYLYVYSDFLKTANITNLYEISTQFHIYNENYKTLYEEEIVLVTDNIGYEQILSMNGTVIVDENDVKIIIQDKYIGKEGLEVKACYINNNDHNINFDITEVMIDDISFGVTAPFELPKTSMTYITFCVFNSDLIRAGIYAENVTEMKINALITNVLNETIGDYREINVLFGNE